MSETASALAWFIERLQQIDKQPSEYGHQAADTILCDAIESLAAQLGAEQEARKLIEAYDAIEKWYA